MRAEKWGCEKAGKWVDLKVCDWVVRWVVSRADGWVEKMVFLLVGY